MTRPRLRTDGSVYRIRWNDGSSGWTPEYAFERLDAAAADVFFLLEKRYFGRLNDLCRNLTFIQLSGPLANVVYSMDTTNTDFPPYQYKPVPAFLETVMMCFANRTRRSSKIVLTSSFNEFRRIASQLLCQERHTNATLK